MSEDFKDPSANTQAFQAWIDQGPQPRAQPGSRSKTPLLVGGAVVLVVVVIAVIAFLALS